MRNRESNALGKNNAETFSQYAQTATASRQAATATSSWLSHGELASDTGRLKRGMLWLSAPLLSLGLGLAGYHYLADEEVLGNADASAVATTPSVDRTYELATAGSQKTASPGSGTKESQAIAASNKVANVASETNSGVKAPEILVPAKGNSQSTGPRSLAKNSTTLVARGAMLFQTDSADLSADTKKSLDAYVIKLRQQPKLRLQIAGHADERGTRQYNYRLGMRRAEAAKSYLMAGGIKSSRIETMSYGKSKPLAKGQGASQQAINRRVEVRELGPSAKTKSKR